MKCESVTGTSAPVGLRFGHSGLCMGGFREGHPELALRACFGAIQTAWTYFPDTGLIQVVPLSLNLCITAQAGQATLEECAPSRQRQRWSVTSDGYIKRRSVAECLLPVKEQPQSLLRIASCEDKLSQHWNLQPMRWGVPQPQCSSDERQRKWRDEFSRLRITVEGPLNKRLVTDPFDLVTETYTCPRLGRYGDAVDGGKFMCDIESFRQGCTILSLGSRGDYTFEDDMLKRTPCTLHTFDCTVDQPRASSGRFNYHNICVPSPAARALCTNGKCVKLSKLVQQFSLSNIEVLKMDIEESEYAALSDMLENGIYPKQILLELHMVWFFGQQAVYTLIQALANHGYRVFAKEPNPFHNKCYEISLIHIPTLRAQASNKEE